MKKFMPFIIGIIAIMLTGCSIFLALIISTTKDVDNKNIEDAKKDGSSSEVAVVKKEIVPDEIAELFGVNPDDYDTDEDGLSNYIEIYITGTLPTLADTDEDGTTDADEDADEDGLTNIEEADIGTNLLKVDTDNDGISDYDEVNDYETDPCQYDTDGDKLGDGDEIILGLDPLKKKTDGKTLDSEREFTQDLSENNIDEALISEESEAIPSLTLTASGNINRNVEVISTYSNDFSDSRAIVGKGIDIVGENISEGVLSFELKNSGIMHTLEDTGESFPTALICKYNEDGTTEYLKTDYNEEASRLTAEIEGEGTYFVLDVKNLFDELGLDMPTVSEEEYEVSASAETLSATTLGKSNQGSVATMLSYSESVKASLVKTTAKKTKAKGSAAAMAQADIIFIIDTTGSMGNEISNVKNNINGFIDALKARGVSAALALIDYQDLDADGYDSTKIHKNGASNWFYDMDEYKAAISALSLGNGGDTEECAVDALETARLLDMRASAGKIFVLVTDADYKVLNRYEIPSMDFEIDLLKNAGVSCSVISSSYDKDTYENLYTQTNGIWADINGNFETELTMLADKIGDEIVGDGYWIYLYGPVPVPVRLDAEPEEGSDVDTDKDGIPDIEELESITPEKEIDLDELLTEVSRGVITGTNYGVVSMYKYKSSPVEQDSDFDGIGDWEDEKPCDNHFKGNITRLKDAKVKASGKISFTVDYRNFFKSNKIYNKDISVLSSLFAADIYDDEDGVYVEVNQGASLKGNNSPEAFAELFGMEKVVIEPIGDDNDKTDIVLGHRVVEYNGIKKNIVLLTVRGTNGTFEEWSSNFDVGAHTDEYYELTGEQPEWGEADKKYHKGFSVTANRIKTVVDDYIHKHSDLEAATVLWITGHSRGAGIANLLGALYEDEGVIPTFTYTFAAPNTTTDENYDSPRYASIFNIVNEDDLIPMLPLEYWGFHKYGVIKKIAIEADGFEDKNPFGNRKGTFEAFLGKEYNNNSKITETINAFKEVATTREELYIFTYEDDTLQLHDINHLTREKAEADVEDLKNDINETMKQYCCFEVLEGENGFKNTVFRAGNYQTPAYFMQVLALLATNGGDGVWKAVGTLVGNQVAYKYEGARNKFALIGNDLTGGMNHPHWTETYYLIASNNVFK